MITAIRDQRIATLLTEWHEAGRADFTTRYPSLDYDLREEKTRTERRKYIALNSGKSGAWLVDTTDGMVYRIKGYGVPNKKKCLGHIDTITGADLHQTDWWYRR